MHANSDNTPSATASGMEIKHWKEQVVDLLYWRDLQRTGVVFGASLFLLLSLSVCSIISVISYVALALLSVTISFRIYKGILQAVQKSEDGHPFKMYLDKDVGISSELVHKYGDTALAHFNSLIKELRRLFLVEDLVDSLKLVYTFHLPTCLIGAFSWPVIYEKHQAQIDHYYGLVNKQIKDVLGKIQAKIPGAKPKTE
uniref:Reticulon n=1 Tax=Sinocyclocheilus rhinocerous TaxID=307959 RepID=A0A673K1S1_9TELE